MLVVLKHLFVITLRFTDNFFTETHRAYSYFSAEALVSYNVKHSSVRAILFDKQIKLYQERRWFYLFNSKYLFTKTFIPSSIVVSGLKSI